MKMKDCLAAFLASQKASNRRKSTIQNYDTKLRQFIDCNAQKGVFDFDDITPITVREYLAHRLEEGKADSTVEGERVLLMSWINWLCEEGYIDDLEWRKRIKRIKVDDANPRCLNAEECVRLMNAVSSYHTNSDAARKRDAAIVRLLLDTGLREAEVLSIKMSDIDMVSRSVRVSAQSKSRRERYVYFGSETLRALRAYLRVRKQFFGAGKVWEKSGHAQYLWLTRNKRRMSHQYLWQVISRSAKAASLSDVSPHTLRHTCATMLLRNGMSVTHVQRILGHATITMTMRYVHLVNDDVRDNYYPACPMDKIAASPCVV